MEQRVEESIRNVKQISKTLEEKVESEIRQDRLTTEKELMERLE
jgi:hypothetical protein